MPAAPGLRQGVDRAAGGRGHALRERARELLGAPLLLRVLDAAAAAVAREGAVPAGGLDPRGRPAADGVVEAGVGGPALRRERQLPEGRDGGRRGARGGGHEVFALHPDAAALEGVRAVPADLVAARPCRQVAAELRGGGAPRQPTVFAGKVVAEEAQRRRGRGRLDRRPAQRQRAARLRARKRRRATAELGGDVSFVCLLSLRD